MGPADPAVDAEELDAIGLAGQDALSSCGQLQSQSGEALPIAEGRGSG